MEKPKILKEILREDEILQIPSPVRTKLEEFINSNIEEALTHKALCSATEKEQSLLKQDLAELTNENKKLQNALAELEQMKSQTATSLENLKQDYEKVKLELSVSEMHKNSLQKQNDILTNEKERLSQMVDRRNNEVERLQIELRELETKLKDKMNAQCEALAQMDNCSTKEATLDIRTKMFEQEKSMLQKQIRDLRADSERNINQLTNVRREFTVKLLAIESQLYEKTEELKLSKSINSQLEKTNESLSFKAEDLSIRIKTDAEETQKLIEHYEKELQSQKKLVTLYKENCDESDKKVDDMAKSIKELQSLLHEATDEYGLLETKMKQIEVKSQDEIKEKDLIISQLRDQLATAQHLTVEMDRLNNDSAMDCIAPSASITKQFDQGGLSLSELYSAYLKVNDELQDQKKQNEKMKAQLKHVLTEIEESAPILKRQRAEYNHLVETNAYLTQQIESTGNAYSETKAKFVDLNTKVGYLQRENQKLKTERGDLARQVCHLLQKIEEASNRSFTDTNSEVTTDMTSSEVISKKLVTFANIEELQEQNTKLLLLVRDLSSKLEEIEENTQVETNESLNSKVAAYTKKIEELRSSQEFQTEMIENCMKQRDRYKELYLESIKVRSNDFSGNADDTKGQGNGLSHESKIDELSKTITRKEQEIDDLKNNFEKYKTEKCINEKLITDQLENMRQEIRDLTSKNYKIASAHEFKTEQLKINNKTLEMYKNQITTLEDRNKVYEITISRHETSLKGLTEEILKTQNKLTTTEMECQHLRQEVQRLRELEIRYTSEREFMQNEKQTQSLLLQNLETIKTNIQKSEIDGRLKLENNLSELSRECSALRRRLQEEQDRFREILSNAESEKRKLIETLDEKEKHVTMLSSRLASLEDELKNKNDHLTELNAKCNTPSLVQNEDEAQKVIRELKKKIEENNIDIASLTQQLMIAREHASQFCQMAEKAEKDWKKINGDLEIKNQDLEKQLIHLRQKEETLNEKIQSLEREFVLQAANSRPITNGKQEFDNLKKELTEAITNLNEVKNEAVTLRAQYMEASNDLRIAEQKYANEMILHSADIQAYSLLKEEHQKLLEECTNMKLSKESTNNILAQHQDILMNLEEKHRMEKQDLESQINDLQSHNSLLLDQVETLGSKLAIYTNSNDQNISFDEDQSKSSEELLRIIKYLRKEKEIALSKLELFNNESVRLKTENKVLQKNVEKLTETLKETPTEAQLMINNTVKHEELLRKLETMNAITDSNRILREERDSLSARVKDLSESVNKLQNELLPLKEKDQELTMKLDALSNENGSLRIEVTRWRQRANLLVERSNKSSPEDIKKLQQDKENLCKTIVAEKEECRKLSDEINLQKTEKLRLEAEVSGLKRTNSNLSDEISKNMLEISIFKENVNKLTSDIKDLKDLHKQELEKLAIELSDKDAQLTDTKNKEMQIRKIAKRYKDSFLELQKQHENKMDPGNSQAINNDATTKSDEIQILTDENNTLKKQIDELKASLEKEERNKSLLKEAKQRIIGLSDKKDALQKELQQLKSKLAVIDQVKPEAGVSSENDVIAQKTKENEELTAKVNQLTRQIALQSVKPMPASTSIEKSSIEPVRTANVRPITPTTQHSTSVTMWRGNETPLASIKPMTVQGGRNAAILGSNQTLGTLIETAASSTYSDSVANSQCGTSTTMVATVPPLGSNVEQPHENSGENYMESNSFQGGSIISQTVALVSPRVETAHGVDTSQQGPVDENDILSNDAEQSESTINMQPASSSVSVSTSQVSLKRNRDTDSTGSLLESPQTKKTRSVSLESDKKALTKFLNEVEYQVPTSSQRDQDDDVIEIDDEREAVLDVGIQEASTQDTYAEEQNSADGSSVDPNLMENPKSLVSSANQESKASSSDALAKPSSSEIWFSDTKNEAEITQDEARSSMLHTTTVNSCEVSVEPEDDITNNDNTINTKNEISELEIPADKEE
ncbi:nucleoprotein TPR [Culicoides brevitarsis]|uniref:nucleoprotein TPR n=1 Tax=Culicoides brevitarsis TaxID=469753 RepID=UPI00307C551A